MHGEESGGVYLGAWPCRKGRFPAANQPKCLGPPSKFRQLADFVAQTAADPSRDCDRGQSHKTPQRSNKPELIHASPTYRSNFSSMCGSAQAGNWLFSEAIGFGG